MKQSDRCSLRPAAVVHVEPEHLAGLFHAHQTELQNARGENESKDFILEHVYQLAPRSIRNPVDFWRRWHISLSTCGLVPKIDRLAQEDLDRTIIRSPISGIVISLDGEPPLTPEPLAKALPWLIALVGSSARRFV